MFLVEEQTLVATRKWGQYRIDPEDRKVGRVGVDRVEALEDIRIGGASTGGECLQTPIPILRSGSEYTSQRVGNLGDPLRCDIHVEQVQYKNIDASVPKRIQNDRIVRLTLSEKGEISGGDIVAFD